MFSSSRQTDSLLSAHSGAEAEADLPLTLGAGGGASGACCGACSGAAGDSDDSDGGGGGAR